MAMKISLAPRLWPAYGRHRGPDDEVLLESLGAGEEVNRAVISGLLVADPCRDRSRDGQPITVILLSFASPDERSRHTSSCCEVEVLDSIADRHRRGLRAGRRVWVVGQLTGAGGLWATALGTSRGGAECGSL